MLAKYRTTNSEIEKERHSRHGDTINYYFVYVLIRPTSLVLEQYFFYFVRANEASGSN